MKKFLISGLVAVSILPVLNATTLESQAAPATVVSEAGDLRNGEDHFFEVAVQSDPVQRLRVQCVTFHELSGVEVWVDGVQIEPEVELGFEEFLVTFAEPIPSGKTIRVVMLNSRVQGQILKGLAVPYRVFANYPGFSDSEFPLGTAVVRSPAKR